LFNEGFINWLARVLHRDPRFFLDEANRYTLAYERLLKINSISCSKKSISQLKAKVDHMNARYTIKTSKQKLRCLSLAIRELITLRYSFYSSGGGKNAVIDLCPRKLAAGLSRFSIERHLH